MCLYKFLYFSVTIIISTLSVLDRQINDLQPKGKVCLDSTCKYNDLLKVKLRLLFRKCVLVKLFHSNRNNSLCSTLYWP